MDSYTLFILDGHKTIEKPSQYSRDSEICDHKLVCMTTSTSTLSIYNSYYLLPFDVITTLVWLQWVYMN